MSPLHWLFCTCGWDLSKDFSIYWILCTRIIPPLMLNYYLGTLDIILDKMYKFSWIVIKCHQSSGISRKCQEKPGIIGKCQLQYTSTWIEWRKKLIEMIIDSEQSLTLDLPNISHDPCCVWNMSAALICQASLKCKDDH